jgi:hypothetical protein
MKLLQRIVIKDVEALLDLGTQMLRRLILLLGDFRKSGGSTHEHELARRRTVGLGSRYVAEDVFGLGVGHGGMVA